jgi:hypothetical protein
MVEFGSIRVLQNRLDFSASGQATLSYSRLLGQY